LGARLVQEWVPQQRGFVRKSLGEGLCDVLVGVPSEFERVLATRPYYRSTYVFVSRRGEAAPATFDDPRLRAMRVGVQLIGNDMAATPPGHALAARAAIGNVTGFTMLGAGPAAKRMVDAVHSGHLDVAVAWGPQAGWFARRAGLVVTPAFAPPDLELPFEFGLSMGVKRGNKALRDELQGVLDRRRNDIDAILAEYAVPRTDLPRIASGTP
jgi:mxaJ protein